MGKSIPVNSSLIRKKLSRKCLLCDCEETQEIKKVQEIIGMEIFSMTSEMSERAPKCLSSSPKKHCKLKKPATSSCSWSWKSYDLVVIGMWIIQNHPDWIPGCYLSNMDKMFNGRKNAFTQFGSIWQIHSWLHQNNWAIIKTPIRMLAIFKDYSCMTLLTIFFRRWRIASSDIICKIIMWITFCKNINVSSPDMSLKVLVKWNTYCFFFPPQEDVQWLSSQISFDCHFLYSQKSLLVSVVSLAPALTSSEERKSHWALFPFTLLSFTLLSCSQEKDSNRMIEEKVNVFEEESWRRKMFFLNWNTVYIKIGLFILS